MPLLKKAPPTRRSYLLIALLLGLLLMTGMACNLLNSVKEAVPEETEMEEAEQPQEVEEEEPVEEPTEEPTEAPVAEKPTQAPQPQASGSELFLTGEQAIIRNEYYTYGMFTATNPRTDCAYQNAEYFMTAYDASGNTLDVESGYLDSVLAGSTVVEILYFSEEAQGLDHFELTLDAGSCEAVQVKAGDITLDKVTLFPNDSYPQATAKVVNNLPHYITDVYVSAVGYNAANEVVAVGSSYVNVLFPSDFSGVVVSMNQAQDAVVDRVVLYPTITYFSEFSVDDTYYDTVWLDSYIPAVQVEQNTELVFWMHNDSPDQAATDIEYQVTIFDADDRVLAVSTGYIDHVLPGDISPTYLSIYLPEGTLADHHFVELTPGGFEEPKFPSNPFTTSNYSIDESGYWPIVTFDLTNTSAQSLTDVEMVVVLYDVDGNFIGGGTAYSEALAANSTTAQEVYVNVSGDADTADVYIVIDFWTEFTE
ncbi:MAG: hypothetical protein HPY85_00295 [Anaerolineae bacterium]|nr:hypothetical protein [Anaerolineae bacterium]